MDTIRYSPTTGAFYPLGISYGSGLPSDVVEISVDDHAAVLAARAAGGSTTFFDGKFTILAPPAPTARQTAITQIAELEATVTQRRLREAALGTDNGWLKAIDAQIAALRATL